MHIFELYRKTIIAIAAILALTCFQYEVLAQHEVIASQGNTYVDADCRINWTLGEVVTGQTNGLSGFTTHGFHQPGLMPSTPVPTVSEWGLIGFVLLLGCIGLVSLYFFRARLIEELN